VLVNIFFQVPVFPHSLKFIIFIIGLNTNGQLGDDSTINMNIFDRVPPFGNGSRHDHTHMDASSSLYNELKRADLFFAR